MAKGISVKGRVVAGAMTACLLASSGIAGAQAYGAGGPGQDYRDPGFGDPAYRAGGPAAPPYAPAGGYDAYDAPPPGYDGSQAPPPPPGYDGAAPTRAQLDADRRYAGYVEDWSRQNCIKARSNAGAGAVIGGVFGALLGSSVAGWRDRGTGALVGGLAGAGAGAAIGSSSAGATSPGCPPGYVVRGGAPGFYYESYGDPYLYAAPGWYRPWYWYDGRWAYRPYPYHVFYYGRFGYGRPYGGYYGYGRPYGYRYGYGRPFYRGRRW